MQITIQRPTDVRTLDVATVRALVVPVLVQWPIARAWLFGSVARGDQRADSDVDVAVMLDEGASLGLAISKLQWDLEDVLLCDVDVILAPVSRRRADFADQFEREKVLIYERAQQ